MLRRLIAVTALAAATLTATATAPATATGTKPPKRSDGPGLIYFYSEPQSIAAGSALISNQGCGSTIYHAISGGYQVFTNPSAPLRSTYYDVKVAASGPEIGTGNFISEPAEVTPGTSENGSWTFHFKNTGTQDAYIKTYAVCMRLGNS